MDTIIYGLSQLAKSLSNMRKSRCLDDINSSLRRQEIILTAIHSYDLIISKDVQRLTHMYLNSALENLRYAQNVSSEVQFNYISQAKSRFIDASVIERNENLILSFLGLSLCQAIMGEENNVSQTLQSIENIKYTDEEMDWNCLDDKKREIISRIYFYKQHGPSIGFYDKIFVPFQLALTTQTIGKMPKNKAEISTIYNKIREKEFSSLRSAVITNLLKNENL